MGAGDQGPPPRTSCTRSLLTSTRQTSPVAGWPRAEHVWGRGPRRRYMASGLPPSQGLARRPPTRGPFKVTIIQFGGGGQTEAGPYLVTTCGPMSRH